MGILIITVGIKMENNFSVSTKSCHNQRTRKCLAFSVPYSDEQAIGHTVNFTGISLTSKTVFSHS